jgi:hypothetical protein
MAAALMMPGVLEVFRSGRDCFLQQLAANIPGNSPRSLHRGHSAEQAVHPFSRGGCWAQYVQGKPLTTFPNRLSPYPPIRLSAYKPIRLSGSLC